MVGLLCRFLSKTASLVRVEFQNMGLPFVRPPGWRFFVYIEAGSSGSRFRVIFSLWVMHVSSLASSSILRLLGLGLLSFSFFLVRDSSIF